jgi:2-keto-4-pentenoate hydratase
MMSSSEVEAIAQELQAAYESGQMLAAPLSSRAGFDLDTAYAVEGRLKKLHEAAGHRALGRKVGYANKAMWRILKLETLVWGHMYDDTVHYAENNAASLAIPRARSLKVEPEIVFGLKEAIAAPGLDAAGALQRTDWIALGFEIIDCPYPAWQFQPIDFVASYGLHAALVVGEKVHVQPEMIGKLVDELPRFTLRMLKDGELVEEGSGKNSLRSPAACLVELGAAILKRSPDEPLGAGEIISSGTLTAGHLTKAGDRWTAEVQGLDLPALTLEMG